MTTLAPMLGIQSQPQSLWRRWFRSTGKPKEKVGATIARDRKNSGRFPGTEIGTAIGDLKLEAEGPANPQGGSHVWPIAINQSSRDGARPKNEPDLGDGMGVMVSPARHKGGTDQFKVPLQGRRLIARLRL